jgi:predicted nucleic acid-binding protein
VARGFARERGSSIAAPFTAFYDANVLYPAELRNLLMHLALTGLFRAKWSADVHEEWISALLEKRPDLTRVELERTRALMDLHAVDALVTGYQDLTPGLALPDPKDRHVLAAAIRGQADVIVTITSAIFLLKWSLHSVSKPNIPMNSSCT